jgi:Fe-S-cluster containining protein
MISFARSTIGSAKGPEVNRLEESAAAMGAPTSSRGPDLDLGLLAGFSFSCRPDCGLCCYAEPRISAPERERLVQIDPEAAFVGVSPSVFLPARGDGGACVYLEGNRCRVHDARPQPCREFPVTVHVGTRLQASAVLSCPGVDLAPLATYRAGGSAAPAIGFDSELVAVRARVDAAAARRLAESVRRHRRIARELDRAGRWRPEEDVRRRLRRDLPHPTPSDFPVEEPPSPDDGLAALPLFFDGRDRPVGLASGIGGWQLLEMDPFGRAPRFLGTWAPPTRPPALAPDGREMLDGYLRYWLERDALFGVVLLAMLDGDEGDATEWAGGELRAIRALTLARAAVRAKARTGGEAPLSARDVADGIRATDQDLLDRETWGDRL